MRAAWALATRRALHRSVDQLLAVVLRSLTDPLVQSRARALKAIQAIIERDQTLLASVCALA